MVSHVVNKRALHRGVETFCRLKNMLPSRNQIIIKGCSWVPQPNFLSGKFQVTQTTKCPLRYEGILRSWLHQCPRDICVGIAHRASLDIVLLGHVSFSTPNPPRGHSSLTHPVPCTTMPGILGLGFPRARPNHKRYTTPTVLGSLEWRGIKKAK